jgi:hypothetical protein
MRYFDKYRKNISPIKTGAPLTARRYLPFKIAWNLFRSFELILSVCDGYQAGINGEMTAQRRVPKFGRD